MKTENSSETLVKSTGLHGVTYQKTIFTVPAIRASNLAVHCRVHRRGGGRSGEEALRDNTLEGVGE
jgi:hypothetical protein